MAQFLQRGEHLREVVLLACADINVGDETVLLPSIDCGGTISGGIRGGTIGLPEHAGGDRAAQDIGHLHYESSARLVRDTSAQEAVDYRSDIILHGSFAIVGVEPNAKTLVGFLE